MSSLPPCNKEEKYFISEYHQKEWHFITALETIYGIFGIIMTFGLILMIIFENQRTTKVKIVTGLSFIIFMICLIITIVKKNKILKSSSSCVNKDGHKFQYN